MRKSDNTSVLILPIFALSEILFFKDNIGMVWTMIVWGILTIIQLFIVTFNYYRKIVSMPHTFIELLLTLFLSIIWIGFSLRYLKVSTWGAYAVILLLFLMTMEVCALLGFIRNKETIPRMLLTCVHMHILTSLSYCLLF